MRDIFRTNTNRHAKVALRKGIARNNWVIDSVLRGTLTGQTSGGDVSRNRNATRASKTKMQVNCYA
jgi:hypothetical protein